jgi:hypothetical protein
MEDMEKIDYAYMPELICLVLIALLIFMGIVAYKLYKELSREDKDYEE